MSVSTVQELAEHAGHNVEVAIYVNADTNAVVECHTCGEILVSFDMRTGKNPCPVCDTGLMKTLEHFIDIDGYLLEECGKCGFMRKIEWSNGDKEE